jgi:hypothetical protein
MRICDASRSILPDEILAAHLEIPASLLIDEASTFFSANSFDRVRVADRLGFL